MERRKIIWMLLRGGAWLGVKNKAEMYGADEVLITRSNIDRVRVSVDIEHQSLAQDIVGYTATTSADRVVRNGDVFSVETFAEALLDKSGAKSIRTLCHTDVLRGGGSMYWRDTTTGLASTGDETHFYNSNGVGYSLYVTDVVLLEQFGLAGYESDASPSIQAAVDFAALNRIGVSSNSVRVATLLSTIFLSNGISFFKPRCRLVAGKVLPMGIIRLGTFDGTAGVKLTHPCSITTKIDCGNFDGNYGIVGWSAENFTISGCEIDGLITSRNCGGLFLQHGTARAIIELNKVTMNVDSAVGTDNIYGLRLNGVFDSYGAYYSNNGLAVEPILAAHHNIIRKNIFYGGSIGIALTGCTDNLVEENYGYAQSHRFGYMQASCRRNTWRRNHGEQYASSFILVNFQSTHNSIHNNECYKTKEVFEFDGEAAINVTTGSTNNYIEYNIINSRNRMGIYIGPDCQQCVVRENHSSGYTVAGICIEAAWTRPIDARVKYYRPDYRAPEEKGGIYGYKDLNGVRILGNTIGKPWPNIQSDTAAIAVLQTGTTVGINKVDVWDNRVQDEGANTHSFYAYEWTPGYLFGMDMRRNRFDAKSTSKVWLAGTSRRYIGTFLDNDLVADQKFVEFRAEDAAREAYKSHDVVTYKNKVYVLFGQYPNLTELLHTYKYDRRSFIASCTVSAGIGSAFGSSFWHTFSGEQQNSYANGWQAKNIGADISGESIEIEFVIPRVTTGIQFVTTYQESLSGLWEVQGWERSGWRTLNPPALENNAHAWLYNNNNFHKKIRLLGVYGFTNNSFIRATSLHQGKSARSQKEIPGSVLAEDRAWTAR